MLLHRIGSPTSTRLLQLAASLLAVLYMLFVGGTFAASLVYQVRLLNFLIGGSLGLIWLLVRLRQRRRILVTGCEWPLLIFALSQWIAVLVSVQPRLGLEWAASMFIWMAIFVIVADLLAGGWPAVYLFNAFIIVAIILAADGLWTTASWFAHWASIGMLPPVAFRYDGLLEQANLSACVINLLWPIVLFRSFQTTRRAVRVALWALVGALFFVEFFTSSRAGWIAAGAGLATMGGLQATTAGARSVWSRLQAAWRRQPALLRLTVMAALLMAMAGAAWLLVAETRQVTHGSLFQSRDTFWSAAWTLFMAHPLTGSGPELFPWFYPRFASIPPEFFAPSAHSLIMQVLSGSGILGLAALLVLAVFLARGLWQRWLSSNRSLEMAGLIGALVSFGVHSLFDYPVTIFILMLLAVIAALALAPVHRPATQNPEPHPRAVHPLLATPLVVLPLAVFAFVLRGAAGNSDGLALADRGQWQAAAETFEQTARRDPGLTLYWEEAAYAYTRAGALASALPLWQRAARDDPYWALNSANMGAANRDPVAAQTAQTLAPHSHLLALNAGAVDEAAGAASAAREAYRNALDLKPSIAAALFWQQTTLRAQVLASWQAARAGTDRSWLEQAQTALTGGDAARAIPLFEQARNQDPESNAAYLGLTKSYLTLGNYPEAERYLQAGLAIPVVAVEDALGLQLAVGDLAEARGDRAAASAAYSLVFNAIDDYDIDGPGTYGFPQRSRIVFHEIALPGEILSQVARADITPEMDTRFAKLAQWDLAASQPDVACHILQRVHQEASVSVSGALYEQQCPAPH